MMEQTINYDNKSLGQPTQNKDKPKYKKKKRKKGRKRKVYKKCNKCNKRRLLIDHKICRICYLYKPSGNEFVDDFIRCTQINSYQQIKMMEFVPYDQFKDIEFIAKGGFSEIYKATWIDGYIHLWDGEKLKYERKGPRIVVLKKLINSENITSEELNEVSKFHLHSIIFNYKRIFNINSIPLKKKIFLA